MKNLEFEPKLITRYVLGALYEYPICQYKIDTTHTDAIFVLNAVLNSHGAQSSPEDTTSLNKSLNTG